VRRFGRNGQVAVGMANGSALFASPIAYCNERARFNAVGSLYITRAIELMVCVCRNEGGLAGSSCQTFRFKFELSHRQGAYNAKDPAMN